MKLKKLLNKNFNQLNKKKRFQNFQNVNKQLKEEDLNLSLDIINPEVYREGKTNIELISVNYSYIENEVSSSLSSNDEERNIEIKKHKSKNKKEKKTKNKNSISLQKYINKIRKKFKQKYLCL